MEGSQTAGPAKPRRTALLIWMICSLLLMLGSLVFWLLVAGLSVMAFDSGVTAEAWAIVIAVWSYPILPIVLTIAAWIAYGRHRNALAGVLAGLSFAPPALCFLFIAISNFAWFARNGGLAPLGN